MKRSFVHNGMTVEIVDFRDGKTTARCVVLAGYPHFEGHFPGFAILPGVSQVELARAVFEQGLGLPVRVKRIRRAKFLGLVRPGMALDISVGRLSGDDAFEWHLGSAGTEYSKGIVHYEQL